MISEFLKRLIFARQFDMNDGKIEILGLGQMMFPINVLKSMNLIERDMMYDVFRKGIKEDFIQYTYNMGLSRSSITEHLIDIFGMMGLGQLSIVDIDNDNKKAILKVNNPKFKDEFTSENKICDTITAGTLAGMFSFIFEDDMQCKEIQCIAFGYECCEFVVKKEL